MDNQHHTLVETVKGNLSKGMRQLNGVYTQYFNPTHNPGSEIFVDKIQLHMKSNQNISETPRAQRRPMSTSHFCIIHLLTINNKNEGIATAYQTGNYAMK